MRLDAADARLVFRRCHQRIAGAVTVQEGLREVAPELEEFFPVMMNTVVAQVVENLDSGVPDGFEDDLLRAISAGFVWGLTLGRELEDGVRERERVDG